MQQKIGKARSSRSAKSVRLEAIKTAYRYLRTSIVTAEKIKYEVDIASLYELNQDYAKAVAVYLAIEKRAEANQKLNSKLGD